MSLSEPPAPRTPDPSVPDAHNPPLPTPDSIHPRMMSGNERTTFVNQLFSLSSLRFHRLRACVDGAPYNQFWDVPTAAAALVEFVEAEGGIGLPRLQLIYDDCFREPTPRQTRFEEGYRRWHRWFSKSPWKVGAATAATAVVLAALAFGTFSGLKMVILYLVTPKPLSLEYILDCYGDFKRTGNDIVLAPLLELGKQKEPVNWDGLVVSGKRGPLSASYLVTSKKIYGSATGKPKDLEKYQVVRVTLRGNSPSNNKPLLQPRDPVKFSGYFTYDNKRDYSLAVTSAEIEP